MLRKLLPLCQLFALSAAQFQTVYAKRWPSLDSGNILKRDAAADSAEQTEYIEVRTWAIEIRTLWKPKLSKKLDVRANIGHVCHSSLPLVLHEKLYFVSRSVRSSRHCWHRYRNGQPNAKNGHYRVLPEPVWSGHSKVLENALIRVLSEGTKLLAEPSIAHTLISLISLQ